MSTTTTRKRYGLTMTHPPNICPIANKASREAAVAGWKQIPSVSQKYGVKVLSFDHFDPEHFIVGMIEAESTTHNLLKALRMIYTIDGVKKYSQVVYGVIIITIND